MPQVAFLKDKFGFTPAEARLVVHIVRGTSLKSSAEALGIKYETVRGYLKSAFLKTGTHRQAELVLKVFHAMSDPKAQPMIFDVMRANDKNDHDTADIICAECKSIIATLHARSAASTALFSRTRIAGSGRSRGSNGRSSP